MLFYLTVYCTNCSLEETGLLKQGHVEINAGIVLGKVIEIHHNILEKICSYTIIWLLSNYFFTNRFAHTTSAAVTAKLAKLW